MAVRLPGRIRLLSFQVIFLLKTKRKKSHKKVKSLSKYVNYYIVLCTSDKQKCFKAHRRMCEVLHKDAFYMRDFA